MTRYPVKNNSRPERYPYALAIHVAGAPEDFCPMGSIDKLKIYYQALTESIPNTPEMQKNLEAGLALYSLKRSPDFTVKPITPEVMAKKIQAILEGDDIFELQSDELETALQELGQSVEHGSQRVGVLFNDAVKTGILNLNALSSVIATSGQDIASHCRTLERHLQTTAQNAFSGHMSDAVRTEAGAFVNKAWLLDENNAGRLLNIDLLKGTPPRLPLIATCAR